MLYAVTLKYFDQLHLDIFGLLDNRLDGSVDILYEIILIAFLFSFFFVELKFNLSP